MELWFTEIHTPNVRFSIKVDRQLYSYTSEFQRIDIFESQEFGRILTLDGLMMVAEKDEFIYHDMIVHVPMATNPEIKRVLLIGAGDGGAEERREPLPAAVAGHGERVAGYCVERAG